MFLQYSWFEDLTSQTYISSFFYTSKPSLTESFNTLTAIEKNAKRP